MESPVEYPKITLGGTEYEVKFTRGLLYRLEKAGIVFTPAIKNRGASCGLVVLMETLHMAIGFKGTVEELTEIAFDQRDEVLTVLVDGWGKVMLPSLQTRAAAVAKRKPAQQTPAIQ